MPSTADLFENREKRTIGGYAIAVFSVFLALFISHWPSLHLESAPVSLFLCAVMLSAWFGGIGPGCLALVLSSLGFYYFLPPMDTLLAKPGQMARFVVFVLSAMVVGALSVAQRRATESLRKTRDDLKEMVQKLKEANESHARSEAYLAGAQTLSHTGSFGWDISTGEQFWSEETYRIFEYDQTVEPTLQLAFDRVHPEDVQLVQQVTADTSQDGRDVDVEHRLLMPDGRVKTIRVLGHTSQEPDGKPIFLGAITDISVVKNAFEEIRILRDQLYKENLALREEIDVTRMFEEIVGSSPALQAVLAKVAKVAPTDSTVLITGETGTGKELIARAIHKRSPRSTQAFISVNCAAIPRDLVASELFGHEKGAFTGATQRRLGRFESADGGTIFLDEAGELPPETQISLLRVLQEREFQRVGSNESLQIDVRIVAATNRDLEAAIAAGGFREDLFYRLNVFPIEVPPLRQRREDIPLLVEYFVDRYASKAGKRITGIDKRSMDLLQSYSWPGNIRELQNVIERSVIACDTENLSVDESWVGRGAHPIATKSQALSEKLAAQEKELIEAALAESHGRVSGPSGAAAKLGIPQSTLDSKIRSLKIDKHRFRKGQSAL
ncbi:sigma 54-interacting transcriptional regulator [Edaphobacter aggregans]|uniref:sigma 54-interacting transcriptional regulator n=1 Tax=Edaphobacter aggregans TaxID=570835 RepID=UPI00068A5A18|nr:sigma 54-interacting transcriptional regulator [Edaphobacter aggregans]